MLFLWSNGFFRSLIPLGVRVFGNNENEVLSLDNEGQHHVDAYGSDGSPFARLLPDLYAGGHTAGFEDDAVRLSRHRRQQQRAHVSASPATLAHSGGGEGVGDGPATRNFNTGDGTFPVFLPFNALRCILEYRLESAPLPLAVAAAGPRLRLAGEETAIFYFPGAATSVRASAAGTSAASPKAGRDAASLPSVPAHVPRAIVPVARGGLADSRVGGGAQETSATRSVHGASLASVTAGMWHSAWWYGRPAVDTEEEVLRSPRSEGGAEAESVVGNDGMNAPSCRDTMTPVLLRRRRVCLPLCVEVVAPRVPLPVAAVSASSSMPSLRHVVARVWEWVRRSWAKLSHLEAAPCATELARTPIDADEQRAVNSFTDVVDQLWRLRRCALVAFTLECYPVALAERVFSADLCTGARTTRAGDVDAAEGREEAAWRAFRHLRTLRCRGRAGQASAVAISAATAVARGAAHAAPPSSPSAAAATRICAVSLTTLRPHLRLLDLSGSAVAALDWVQHFPMLEKIVLTGCAQLNSLSPLGLAPSLREIVASQSGIYDLAGLAQSTSLESISLYGCLNLTDVGACGRIATLRDVFISESTVEVLEGLQMSPGLTRLGMRYCDIPQLTALAPVSTLRILHAASSTLVSVAPLQHCASLEVVEVAACALLTDLGPLGLAPNLRELDASGSGVRHVGGLRHSASLEKLMLAHCLQLEDVGPLGQCVNLRRLSLTGTRVQSLEGLAGAPALSWLDISFCRQLTTLGVLLQLPRLRQVMACGCSTALRRPDDVASVVERLRERDDSVVLKV